jgi:hypothetical protein
MIGAIGSGNQRVFELERGDVAADDRPCPALTPQQGLSAPAVLTSGALYDATS